MLATTMDGDNHDPSLGGSRYLSTKPQVKAVGIGFLFVLAFTFIVWIVWYVVTLTKSSKNKSTSIIVDITKDPHGFSSGTRLVSPNGVYSFSINLPIPGGSLLTIDKRGKRGWKSHALHKKDEPATLYLHGDGTFQVMTENGEVLLDQVHNVLTHDPTHFTTSSMHMQNNGDLVVYSSIGDGHEKFPVWSSGTFGKYWTKTTKWTSDIMT